MRNDYCPLCGTRRVGEDCPVCDYREAEPAAPMPEPLPPLDPLAGSLGREWWDGWARVHGFGATESAA